MYKMRPASRGGEVVSSVAFYELRTRNSGAGGDSYALFALLYLLESYALLYLLGFCALLVRCLSRNLSLLAWSTGKEPVLA